MSSLLIKKFIVKSHYKAREMKLHIFFWQKHGDEFRFILNSIKLNENLEQTKFKMETLSSVLCFIQPNNYMTKLHIKDAY